MCSRWSGERNKCKVSEIGWRQQAPIIVFVSSCGLDYAYPPSAAGLVACRSMSELMPPVIAVVGTCLVPPLAIIAGCGGKAIIAGCGGVRPADSQPCMYCRSNLIWDFFHYDQRLMRAFFRLKAGVRFRMQ